MYIFTSRAGCLMISRPHFLYHIPYSQPSNNFHLQLRDSPPERNSKDLVDQVVDRADVVECNPWLPDWQQGATATQISAQQGDWGTYCSEIRVQKREERGEESIKGLRTSKSPMRRCQSNIHLTHISLIASSQSTILANIFTLVGCVLQLSS